MASLLELTTDRSGFYLVIIDLFFRRRSVLMRVLGRILFETWFDPLGSASEGSARGKFALSKLT